jgi:hypothetical protein
MFIYAVGTYNPLLSLLASNLKGKFLGQISSSTPISKFSPLPLAGEQGALLKERKKGKLTISQEPTAPLYQVTSYDYYREFDEKRLQDWDNAIEAYADVVRKFNQPIIAVGHSGGGTLLLCARIKYPSLFRDTIIYDPALFSTVNRHLFGFGLKFGRDSKFLIDRIYPLVSITRNRPSKVSTGWIVIFPG